MAPSSSSKPISSTLPCRMLRLLAALALVLQLLVTHAAAEENSSQADKIEPPEWHNGIGDIRVFMFGDDNDKGKRDLAMLRRHCSSKTVMLKSTTGRGWSWHDKVNRLLNAEFRNLPNSQIVLVLDADAVCFPCTRSLTAEFLKFGAGLVVSGYPFQQEPGRWKTGWFPPVKLLDEYSSADDDHAKKSLGLFKYINTGTIIGYAGAIKYYISHHYLMNGYVDITGSFDDQSDFWTNMYLGQEFSPWARHFHSGVSTMHAAKHNADRLIRIAVDAEGSVFQLGLLFYKGRWMRTEKGLQRELPYRKEACIIHFVGENKPGLPHILKKFPEVSVGGDVWGACAAQPTDTSLNWGDENSVKCDDSKKIMDQVLEKEKEKEKST